MDDGDIPASTSTTLASPLPLSPAVTGARAEEEVVLSSWAILILVSLLLTTLLVAHFLEHRRSGVATVRSGFQHETIVALLMGACVGVFVRAAGGPALQQMVSFEHAYFFNLLLPPIILSSGYDLKPRRFFKNFGTILVFAFLGTLIATGVIGFVLYAAVVLRLAPLKLTLHECMTFGSILSSTDPVTIIAVFNQLRVDPDLFAVVFGESMLNDAVAIVLFSTLSKFHGQEITVMSVISGTMLFVTVFFGSLLIGVIIGLIASLTLKHGGLNKSPSLESCVVTLLAYSSYLLSNSIHLSGIVSLLFCSITLKHYAYNNMSLRTRRTTRYMFRVLSQLAENFCFIYLGVTLFANGGKSGRFSFAVLLSRYASITPLATTINRLFYPRTRPLLPLAHQRIMWWAGMRGAIAFALSFELETPSDAALAAALRTTTLVVCVASVIGLGGTVAWAVRACGIRTGVVDEDEDDPAAAADDDDDADADDARAARRVSLCVGGGVFLAPR
ncbi:monovalent cation:H+ antiporter, CPA1 (nhx1) [Entophlyctis luteolus]|nr:monovalent cation:H+ antiporter, CPA1 (nhx1) [Entophlyctis luteolus]